jgi:hypothetical protein
MKSSTTLDCLPYGSGNGHLWSVFPMTKALAPHEIPLLGLKPSPVRIAQIGESDHSIAWFEHINFHTLTGDGLTTPFLGSSYPTQTSMGIFYTPERLLHVTDFASLTPGSSPGIFPVTMFEQFDARVFELFGEFLANGGQA